MKIKFTKPQLNMLVRARECETNFTPFKVPSSGKDLYVAERLRDKGLLALGDSQERGYVYTLTARGRFVADEQGIGAGGNITQLNRYTFPQEALEAVDTLEREGFL